MNFLNKAESKSFKPLSTIWTSSDLMTTAAMIWPHLLKKTLITNVTPVIDGAARGIILVDYADNSAKPKNVQIVQEILVDEYKQKLMYHFS